MSNAEFILALVLSAATGIFVFWGTDSLHLALGALTALWFIGPSGQK